MLDLATPSHQYISVGHHRIWRCFLLPPQQPGGVFCHIPEQGRNIPAALAPGRCCSCSRACGTTSPFRTLVFAWHKQSPASSVGVLGAQPGSRQSWKLGKGDSLPWSVVRAGHLNFLQHEKKWICCFSVHAVSVCSFSLWQEHLAEFLCNIASARKSGLGNVHLFPVLGQVIFAQVPV